jgi:hypothetical protein
MAENAEALAPWLHLLSKDDTTNLRRAALLYGQERDQETAEIFVESIRETLALIDPNDPRDVLLSSEDLVGTMPWRHGHNAYDHAAAMLKTFCAEARKLPHHEVHVLLTLRRTEAWARSCYSQHLRSTPIRLTLEAYMNEPAAHCDLLATAQEVEAVISPIPLHVAWLEDIGQLPLGPATAALQLLPQIRDHIDRLRPSPRQNTALPKALAEELFQLNHAGLDEWDLKAAKKKARQAYWRKRRRSKQGQ